jgi:hypothetical protein
MLLFKDCNSNMKRVLLLNEYQRDNTEFELALQIAALSSDPDKILREHFDYDDNTEI